jgi:gas vesicle protein
MEDQERNFSLTAFLVGGILGASASLLFTPKSGRELRADIKRQADEYINDVKLKADKLIQDSKSTGERLKRKAEDLMESVKQYAKGKADKPMAVIEKEINGLKAAINAAKASYSVTPEVHKTNINRGNGHSVPGEFDDESLPKHIGMGKGRDKKSFYS